MNDRELFIKLTELIKEYDKNKESYDVNQLQNLRDNISLTFFYLSDAIGKAYKNYEVKQFQRKESQADVIVNRGTTSFREAEHKARLESAQGYLDTAEALRVKKRVDIIVTSIQQILNSLSTRIKLLERK